jgi:hypothetical protein
MKGADDRAASGIGDVTAWMRFSVVRGCRFDTNGDGRLDKTEVENALLSILKEKVCFFAQIAHACLLWRAHVSAAISPNSL